MDNKAAIKELAYLYDKINDIRSKVAIDAGIKALEQEPKTDVLDKIRAEIADIYCGQYCEHPFTADEVREMALEIIDKYTAETE